MNRKKSKNKSLFICNLQCDFLVPVLKKLRWVNFSSPSKEKKNYNCPQKTMKNVLQYLEQPKKIWKKSCKKIWKTIDKKIWKKLQNIHKKHMMNEKRLLNAVTIFESKEWNKKNFYVKEICLRKKTWNILVRLLFCPNWKKKYVEFWRKKFPFLSLLFFPEIEIFLCGLLVS